jgi:ribosomal peptide maturation radical SAM protein 1
MTANDHSNETPVLLVSAPFAFLHKPSLALSLLKAALGSRSIGAKIRYYTLSFAALVGDRVYERIAEGEPSSEFFVGEWIFSAALSEETQLPPQAYLDEVLLGHRRRSDAELDQDFLTAIVDMRAQAVSFVDTCVEDLLRNKPRVVGLTSTYQQHACSLAIAKRLKMSSPETFLIMGGANCEGIMGAETLKQFKFLDAVVSGEAEQVFPELVEQVLAGEPPAAQQGLYLRADIARRFAEREFESAPLISDLDSLPQVSYEDYFGQYSAAAPAFADQRAPDVLLETSRGCWFGEKSHCTFCGLNGAGMAYRSKSATRALEEFVTMSDRHPESTINVVDNILNMKYFNDFIPMLATLERELHVFYETKSNLSRLQIAALRKAGIRSIQPGIESLSNDVLKRMKKGVNRLQNVQLLKWCLEEGVTPYWNIIWGLPGESPEDYLEMAELVPRLLHLPPPYRCGPVRLDRFSPLCRQAEEYGFRNVRPFPSYKHVYPLDDETLANMAYYFTHDDEQKVEGASYASHLLDAVATWRDAHEESALFSKVKGEELHIWDLRRGADRNHFVLDRASRRIYEACDARRSLRGLAELTDDNGTPLGVNRIEDLVGPLVDSGLVLRDNGQILSLAIPLGRYEPTSRVMAKFFEVALDGLDGPGQAGSKRRIP